jgi:oryzin
MVGFKNFSFLAALLPAALAAPFQPNTVRRDDPAANVIADSYIVTLKPNVQTQELDGHVTWANELLHQSLSRRDLGGVGKTYNIDSFKGYSGSFDAATIEQIKASPLVC